MASSEAPPPRQLWKHPNPQSTQIYKFMQLANNTYDGLGLESFADLYNFSTANYTRCDFWRLFIQESGMIYEGSTDHVVDSKARMDSIPRWFEGLQLNFAENMLFERGAEPEDGGIGWGKGDEKVAVTEVREGCEPGEIVDLSWGELRERVGLLSNAMRTRGLKKGDRVALVASNSIDTLVVILAVTSLGGMFSTSSTDMGVKGILDRLLQVKPKWLFFDDWAVYNGKTIDLRSKITEVVEAMKSVSEFEGVVTQPRFKDAADVSGVPRSETMAAFCEAAKGDTGLTFTRVGFNDPLVIVYSSGTTGQPKCIVHSVGGILLSSNKEARLHRDFNPSTVMLQYTTTGWIMYLSAINGLLQGARAVLYDGSPFQPEPKTFVKLMGDQKITNLGVSPRYFHELQKAGISPRDTTDLSNLRAVTSTGMVLKDELFEWFYDVGFPPEAQLANISGGTDIAGCFALENPLTPVYVGGCQGPSLGTPIAIYDQLLEGGKGVEGREVPDGTPGELVATKSFPNMPVFFYGEDAAQKYFKAYFERFDNVWTHGDFVQIHPDTQQILFLGRADGVLNPSGVRFGSAEIYNVIEKHFNAIITDSLCVGQRRPQDDDEAVMLFLLMGDGKQFSAQLVKDVKDVIGRELSKRHVPKYVFECPAIPTTVNMKKVELPVKQIVSGVDVKPSGTLLNPESLKFFYQFREADRIVKEGAKSKL